MSGGILYSYVDNGSVFDTYSGMLSNISGTGACIYTQESLEKGRKISVYSRSFLSRAPREATVMWCNRIYDDLYMAGLLFPGNI